ncbi:MAG: DEAD/DEAH box helicase [Candidatus Heimdallarchaeota archaeon]|nr:DEAD/DEAH box helicase [Candidatus Heimdallarchaeota archaeon]
MSDLTSILLNDKDIQSLIIKSQKNEHLAQVTRNEIENEKIESTLRLIYLLINHSFTSPSLDNIRELKSAYVLLKSINIKSSENQKLFGKILGIEGLNNELLYFFYLAVISIKYDKIINAKIDLLDYSGDSLKNEPNNWMLRVLNKLLNAFILIARKKNGFADIRESLFLIEKLKQEQKEFEEKYLNQKDFQSEVQHAYILLALYHLSKSIVEVANYLVLGYEYKKRIENEIRQYSDIARKLLVNEPRLQSLVSIIEESLKTISANSIWSKTKFNDRIQKLCRYKAEHSNLIDLLPSQRDAISSNLLDVASNVIVLQMPTSAGKTLLAEFNILVTKALRQDAKIVYVVPSRALVNQVYFDLKSDFSSVGLNVEKTSSAIELDPNENNFLLTDSIDILVSTPEKLDLLIRRNHPSVEDVSLFVIDEAHCLQNGERGAKLELLLALLRRARPDAKFMLLSPFIKNTENTLVEWLGGGISISIDWKPSEKLLIGLNNHKNKTVDEINYSILNSPYSVYDIAQSGSFQNPYHLKSSGSKERILEFSINHFVSTDKTILVLCGGKKSADNRAEFIYNNLQSENSTEDIELIQKYIIDEVGKETILTKVLKSRICTHHAGLSDETKLLLEYLIRNKQINYVCSTTTVAEGVNFPVSTVFFDSFKRGRKGKITSNDFWNIAGRAGRTMIDNYGRIILPFNSDSNIDSAKELIETSANQLVSVLSELFINADRIQSVLEETDHFGNLFGEFSDSLSPLIQYFTHLISIGEHDNYLSQIEDLFKDSLEYYLLDSNESKEKFINVCKSIYIHLQKKYGKDTGLLSFADKTGFSIPSVLRIMKEKSSSNAISDLQGWLPKNIFDKHNIDNLTEKIKVIATLKETHLGTDSDKAPFNPKAIAEVIIAWVKGDNLYNISGLHPFFNKMKESERINEFVSKMRDISFKSSWGLSALEGIVKGNVKEINDSYIPSMVYYGVDNEKSLALRMVGIPRTLSFSLSSIIEKDVNKYSYNDLRKMIKGLTNSDWDSLKPKKSNLDGQEWKRISDILIK